MTPNQAFEHGVVLGKHQTAMLKTVNDDVASSFAMGLLAAATDQLFRQHGARYVYDLLNGHADDLMDRENEANGQQKQASN